MRPLSKSKLLCYRQCPKRLWLEIHHPDKRSHSLNTVTSFAVGHQVGEIARRLYDRNGKGILIDINTENFDNAFTRTRSLLRGKNPVFETGFCIDTALAFADIMLPVKKNGKSAWRMVEVKSSTTVKDYHRDDVAIQSYIARKSGVPLAGIALAHIDSSWTYTGSGDYRGLLVEHDLTSEAFDREAEVKNWIDEAQAISRKRREPCIHTGRHCTDPHECGFFTYCSNQEPQAKFPAQLLPKIQSKALKSFIEESPACDLRKIPDALLNETQLRVKTATLSGKPYFDPKGAAKALQAHTLPAYFLDFETIQFAVPIWKGTCPYQQIPFQFSLHKLSRTGTLNQTNFLDLSGKDPSKALAEALIASCGDRGPVFAYNAGFERSCIRHLAKRFPRLTKPLHAIGERLVDLLPVAQDYFYHPHQRGSWSIKAVLPAICPDLNYELLEGVKDGGMAMTAYFEAIAPDTSPDRKSQIKNQLLEYCTLDTYALVRLWSFFTGNRTGK